MCSVFSVTCIMMFLEKILEPLFIVCFNVFTILVASLLLVHYLANSARN